jgi:hypothetical protein
MGDWLERRVLGVEDGHFSAIRRLLRLKPDALERVTVKPGFCVDSLRQSLQVSPF